MSNYPPGALNDPRAPWNATDAPCPHEGRTLGTCPACALTTCDDCVSAVSAVARGGEESHLCRDCASFLAPCVDCLEPREHLYDGRCAACEQATAGSRS